MTLNGISTMTLQAGGHLGGQTPDMGSAAEVTIDHTGVSADLPTGGVRINFIPRDGGNSFATSVFFGFSNESLQGDNFTPALEAAGLRVPNKIENNFDLNASFGGPILQDKLWYWFSYRRNEVTNFAPINVNANAYMPNEWLPAFTNEQARDRGKAYNSSVRMTWQATPRNKFAGTYKFDSFNDSETSIGATRTIEATRDFRFPRLTQEHAEWTSPMSNNLLLEAVGMHLYERWGGMHAESARGSRPEFADVARQMIGVTDQGLGNLNYRAPVAATEQHPGAELHLPRGCLVHHGHAQHQGGLQRHLRVPGAAHLRPEQQVLPVPQWRTQPRHPAGVAAVRPD